jgi:alpha-L-rhamnosidase
VVPGVAAGPDLPRLPFADGAFYSLSYSINFVTNLYDYYLYTGDKRLVEREWSAVESEFAYLAANANGQHLGLREGRCDKPS